MKERPPSPSPPLRPKGPETPAPSEWTRPKPVEQDSNFLPWMLFLAGVSLTIALWVPARTVWQRLRYQPDPAMIRDADSFIALAYSGISSGRARAAHDVSRAQFEQQIRALHERGYQAIGLQDVADFYQKGALLPQQAVLITMEQSERSSYLETRDLLQQYRWPAVMFVRSDTIARGDQDALRWPILRDMQRSANWDVGAQSANGFMRIPAGPSGETGNFFSTPKWLESQSVLEHVSDFSERIRAEHRRTVAEFQQKTGTAPVAFAFPYGDYGQYDPQAVATRVMNLAAVETFYDLGFALGPFMLNTRRSNPHALNRMQVDPEWSMEEFIEAIESAQALPPWSMENATSLRRWRTTWGIAEATPESAMVVRAVRQSDEAAGPPGTGALTWLLGSDLFEDFTVTLRFRLRAGHFGVRFRYRPGGEEGIRFLMDSSGNCRLTQKLYGSEALLLAAEPGHGISPRHVHELTLSLSGRTLSAKLDGEWVLREPIELLTEPFPGMFGLEVWDPQKGVAAVEILSLEFPRQRDRLVYWPAEMDAKDARLIAALHAAPWRYAAISPPWMDVKGAVPLVMPDWDDQALAAFAEISAAPVMPRIAVHAAELAVAIPAEKPVAQAARMEVAGLYIDARHLPPDEIPALMPWIQSVYETAKEHDMRLALTLPEAVMRTAAFASITALFPDVTIAASPAVAAEHSRSAANVVVSEALTLPPSDLHLKLYHQLALREMPEEALSPQARQDANRNRGLRAYHDGQYEEAIGFWEGWLEDDPRNVDALGLIGRAYVKLAEPEKALEHYTRSLAVAPGQIGLAVRRAELLDSIGQTDEARRQLNLYARIFPDNPDILIAQAEWLDRRKRRIEARTMLETLVEEQPLNIAARTALLKFQDHSSERYQTLRDVLALGRSPDARLPFGHMLLSQELLTYPESGVFFDFIRQRAQSDPDTPARQVYDRFLPLNERVKDNFALGRLSDEWIASDGIRALERGRYELRTAVDQAEAYLRLYRSELMRDGYLDVVLDETQGFFWIYARRSARAMVRFGFDQEGYIHIQAWHNGDLLAHHSRPWIRPPGSLNLRLELRGDGARGFVNGMDVFDTPLNIPARVAYGWWGIAPFAFELGMARARILQMECQPLQTSIALIAPGSADTQIVQLRPYAGHVSALAPAWIFQNPDGSLPTALPEDAGLLRMFSAFHGIRLLPVIDLAYDGAVDPEEVVQLVHKNHLDGALVKFRKPPSPEWKEALRLALEKRPANVILMITEAALWNSPLADAESIGDLTVRPQARDQLLPEPDQPLVLREMPIGGVMLSPLHAEWTTPIADPDAPPPAGRPLVQPRMHLLGADGWMSRADTPAPAFEAQGAD